MPAAAAAAGRRWDTSASRDRSRQDEAGGDVRVRPWRINLGARAAVSDAGGRRGRAWQGAAGSRALARSRGSGAYPEIRGTAALSAQGGNPRRGNRGFFYSSRAIPHDGIR
jgi:hypothetical protein